MENPPNHPRKELVRLDAWVAASQPNMGPARRGILEAVAELTADGSWVASSQIKDQFGGQRQPVNRHLRALENDGLVLLENRGRGLPLYVKATAAGRRAVNMRGFQRTVAPQPEPILEPDLDLETPEPRVVAEHPRAAVDSVVTVVAPEPMPPAGSRIAAAPQAPLSRGERFARALYAALGPYLHGLGYQEFRGMLLQTLAEALGHAPSGQITGTTPVATIMPEEPEPGPTAQVLPMRRETDAQVAAPMPPSHLPSDRQAGALAPPALAQAEEALEERLNVSCHAERREQVWWARTKDFSTLWDQISRWRLGSLATSFTSFGPRWRHPEWADFNRARRQADARGARYADWIQAQFDRVNGPVKPSDLHGEEALAAWHKKVAVNGGLPGQGPLGPAPYTLANFNINNPRHVAHAEDLIVQITSLASRVFGQDSQGPVRLLTQAVVAGNLPEAALELRPLLRDRVLAALGRLSSPAPALPAATVASTAPVTVSAQSAPAAPSAQAPPVKAGSRQTIII